MQTFDDLQIPFALFKAPLAHAVTYPAGNCMRCGSHVVVRFDAICYSCFRAGFSDSAIDTELGMVTKELANAGITHGLPIDDPSKICDYKLTPHPVDPDFPDDTWYYFHISADLLHELLRTPRYHTWQGERWQFCCSHPMIFRGSLPADMFPATASEIEREMRLFLESPAWERTVGRHGSHTLCAFTCSSCGSLKYHEDFD